MADTVAHPDAVVVETSHAVVAQVAVGGKGGPHDCAGLAEFETAELVGLLAHIRDPLIFAVDLCVATTDQVSADQRR